MKRDGIKSAVLFYNTGADFPAVPCAIELSYRIEILCELHYAEIVYTLIAA